MASIIASQLSRTHVNPGCTSNCHFRNRAAPLSLHAPRQAVRTVAAASVAAPAAQSASSALIAEPREASTSPSRQEQEWAGFLPNCSSAAVLSLSGRCGGLPKANNQDTFLAHTLQPLPGAPASVIGVFDGHGRVGHVASNRVRDTMAAVMEQCALAACRAPAETAPAWETQHYAASNLGAATALSAAGSAAAALEFTPESAQSCLMETFNRAADAMRAAAQDFMNSGSTAVVCMVLPDSVVAAWAGDSRAVIGTAGAGGEYSAVDLTKDHKPNHLSEMTRIMAAGGRVARVRKDKNGNPAGPYRVFLPVGVSPGLSVARAFGDTMLSQVGVVPTPDLTVFPLSGAPAPAAPSKPRHVLVVASDGLWEFVGSQAAVDMAAGASSPEDAARLLAHTARQKWEAEFGGQHCDDITVAVAFLP